MAAVLKKLVIGKALFKLFACYEVVIDAIFLTAARLSALFLLVVAPFPMPEGPTKAMGTSGFDIVRGFFTESGLLSSGQVRASDSNWVKFSSLSLFVRVLQKGCDRQKK
jgi:hypothetical protein